MWRDCTARRDFGFSQEFAEYRAYTEGDDLRHVDWNVFARTERMYLKRYRGETNTQLTILLDASASMAYGSHKVNKLDLRALSDGIDLRICRISSATRRGSSSSMTRSATTCRHRAGRAVCALVCMRSSRRSPGTRTDFAKPFFHCQNFLHRRGIIVVVSDFYEDPEVVIKTMEPMRFHGNEIILFHVLDPQEIRPKHQGSSACIGYGNWRHDRSDAGLCAATSTAGKIDAHIAGLRERAQRSGIDYFLIDTSQPLDDGIAELSCCCGRGGL